MGHSRDLSTLVSLLLLWVEVMVNYAWAEHGPWWLPCSYREPHQFNIKVPWPCDAYICQQTTSLLAQKSLVAYIIWTVAAVFQIGNNLSSIRPIKIFETVYFLKCLETLFVHTFDNIPEIQPPCFMGILSTMITRSYKSLEEIKCREILKHITIMPKVLAFCEDLCTEFTDNLQGHHMDYL